MKQSKTTRPHWSKQQQKGANMHDEDEEKGVVCDGCHQRLNRLRYSNKQWNEFSQRKYAALSRRQDPKKVAKPFCRACNGEPAVDKRCVGCEKDLPLEKFSKNARKNKDNARCINCTQEREDLEADPRAAVQEQKIYDQIETMGGASAWSMKSVGSALPSDLSSRFGAETVSTTGTNPRSTFDDGVWISHQSVNSANNSHVRDDDSVSAITENTERIAPSNTSTTTNGTWANFAPVERTYQRVRQASNAGTTNTGFAKQAAYRDDVYTRMKNKYENDKAKRQEAEDELDDSDDQSNNDSDFEL